MNCDFCNTPNPPFYLHGEYQCKICSQCITSAKDKTSFCNFCRKSVPLNLINKNDTIHICNECINSFSLADALRKIKDKAVNVVLDGVNYLRILKIEKASPVYGVCFNLNVFRITAIFRKQIGVTDTIGFINVAAGLYHEIIDKTQPLNLIDQDLCITVIPNSGPMHISANSRTPLSAADLRLINEYQE